MAKSRYIGSRYVPIFADPYEWDNTRLFEPLTIVSHNGSTYTSKQFVPRGIDISNTDFWALTAAGSGDVQEFIEELQNIRTAADGTVYDTAGEAVRAQVNMLNEKDETQDERIQQNENADAETLKQVQRNSRRLDLVEAIITEGGTGWQLEKETSYEHIVPGNAVCVEGETYSYADLVGIEGETVVWNQVVNGVNAQDPPVTAYGITRTRVTNSTLHYSGTSTLSTNYTAILQITPTAGHKYFNFIAGNIPSTCGIAGSGVAYTAGVFGYLWTPTQGSYLTYGVYVPSETSIDTDVSCFCIDLTQLFGAGNEPTTLDDPRITWVREYAESHPEYNEGALVSADVESVESWGKNLFDNRFANYYRPYDYYVCPIDLKKGEPYVLRATLVGTPITGATLGVVPFGDRYSEFKQNIVKCIDSLGATFTQTIQRVSDIYTDPKLIAYIPSSVHFDDIFKNYNIQLERGTTATPYSPYGMKDEIELPEEARALRSVPGANVRDRLDFVADKVERKVNAVRIGDYVSTFAYRRWGANNALTFPADDLPNFKPGTSDEVAGNIFCAEYTNVPAATLRTTVTNKAMCLNIANIRFVDSSFNDLESFAAYVSDLTLIYEVADPDTETLDLDRTYLKAEPNGSIRFAQPNDATMPVPNAVSFYVNRLKGVVSNGE